MQGHGGGIDSRDNTDNKLYAEEDEAFKIELLMKQAHITTDDRKVIQAALARAEPMLPVPMNPILLNITDTSAVLL